MTIIAEPRLDYSRFRYSNIIEDNLAMLLEYLNEKEDEHGDPVFDYYSMAFHTYRFLKR